MKKKYIVDVVFIVVFVVSYCFFRKAFSQEGLSETFRILSDAFMVPGIFLCCLAGFAFSANRGAYNMISFGFGRTFRWFIPMMNKERYDKYYDYMQYKEKKRKPWSWHSLIPGAVCLLIAVIFLVLYFMFE